ncbi:MAG: hypothetical protein EOP47_16800 [Sphingobacteriaceae bacterium]|nr:MAG: hypothetical protein EOP47_16800 [Sphingobacteriaceae bacterium]
MLKRILFDNQIFRRQPYGGISKYFTELLTGIKNYPEFEILPEKFYSDNVNLVINNLTRFNEFRSIIDFPGKPIIEKVIYRWEIIKTRDRLKKGDFDIFHPTYYIPYFASALPANKKLVLTVHDMIHENYYNHLYEHIIEDAAWKQTLIPRADHIITVSQFTKNQVLKFFPEIDESRISVIHHGIRPYAGKSNKQLDLPEKYILYVGIRKHYKKFPWLAEALGDYIKKNGITLLCAGAKDFDPYEKEMLDRWNLGEQVKYFFYVIQLYTNAVISNPVTHLVIYQLATNNNAGCSSFT